MQASTNKSRPVYQPISIDPTGRWHLLVGYAEGGTVIDRCLAACPGNLKDDIAVLRGNDAAALLREVDTALAAAKMGLRLYVAGPETFLWDLSAIAIGYGMGKNEIGREVAGSIARRVFCVHCRTVAEAVTTDIHDCAGCGYALQVRDHFSRRMGAFMGVRIDAEMPGQIPERREAFP
jgi:hypothetical protein